MRCARIGLSTKVSFFTPYDAHYGVFDNMLTSIEKYRDGIGDVLDAFSFL